jgi:hypothetical protein
MLQLPVSEKTFQRSFLNGDGQVEISSDQDVWRKIVDAGGVFDPTIDRVADVKIGVGGTRPVQLGGAGTIKIGLSGNVQAIHQIALMWPAPDLDLIKSRRLQPAAGQLLVRLLLEGRADASAKGSAPVGPLKTALGVSGGGSFGYERLKLYPASTPAGAILADLFAGLRLPQQIDSEAEIPARGEVLVSRFGGYLKVNGQVSYGYSMSGSAKEIAVGGLNLDLDYRLKLSAGLTAGFQIAGDFEIEASAGSSTGYVRFVVRKSRESEFNFAADVGVDAGVHLKGLPDTSGEFLAKVFGSNGESVLKLFDKARTYSDLDELEKAAGKLAKGAVHDLAGPLIGKALDNGTVAAFLEKIRGVVDRYNRIDSRIVHLYEDYTTRIPQLSAVLDTLSKAATREALKAVTDPDTWALVNRLAGTALYDILLEDSAFSEFAGLVGKARSFVQDEEHSEVRETITRLKSAVPLDGLLQKLAALTKPEELKNLADQQLQGLAEKLLNRGFDEIRKGNAAASLKEIHAAVERVAAFQKKYYDKIKEVADRSYQAQLHLGFARASKSQALLDVEVDLTAAEGPRLARLAAGGDFAELLGRYSSKLVRINKGVFTHSLASSTQLQVNLFGYGLEGMTRVFQQTEEALEAHDGGLLHIYTTKTQMDQRRKHGGEVTASTFLFATVAKALQPEGAREFLIRTLPKMSVQYDLLVEDDKTSPDEMRKMLELGELMGIVNAASFTDRLRQEFPGGLGKVTARYVVRYDSEAVNMAFQIKDTPDRATMRALARETMRSYVSARYIGLRRTDWMAPLGFAYASPQTFELYQQEGFAQFAKSHISLTLPAWFTKGAPSRVELRSEARQILTQLYAVEKSFLDRLVKLDTTIDVLRDGGGVSSDHLNKQVLEFVEMADDLGACRENAFFVVFDRLVQEGSGGKTPRNSALMLEITPPGGEKVHKVLTAVQPAAVL